MSGPFKGPYNMDASCWFMVKLNIKKKTGENSIKTEVEIVRAT